MEENEKTTVEISDEGVFYIDYLTTGCEYVFQLCIKKSCRIIMKSEHDYYMCLGEMKMWMNNNKSTEEIEEVTAYIKAEWEYNKEIIKMFDYD